MGEYVQVSVGLNEIIKVLGVKQKNSLTDFRPYEKKLYRDAPEFIEPSISEKNMFIETEIGEGDMFTQLLRIINPKFQIIGNKLDVVKELRNRMAFDLDKLKLGVKFGYNKDKTFDRKKVYDILLNKDLKFTPDVFGKMYSTVMKYLADYFDINIIIYNSDYRFENLGSVDIYYSKRVNGSNESNGSYGNGKICKSKPMVEFIWTTRFCPLVNKDGCGVRQWNDRIEKVYQSVKMDLINYKVMAKYKLSDLEELAKLHKLQLKKPSEKTGKPIKKSKKDIYENLYYLVDL